MRDYVEVVMVSAGIIKSVKQITPRGDHKISIVGSDETAVVPGNWVDTKLPKVGDYLVQDVPGKFTTWTVEDFESRFTLDVPDLTED